MKSFWRGLLAGKTGVCLAFTGASVIYLIIAALMGERTVSILTLMGLLVVSVAGTAIQYLCFASPRTEGWGIPCGWGCLPSFFCHCCRPARGCSDGFRQSIRPPG